MKNKNFKIAAAVVFSLGLLGATLFGKKGGETTKIQSLKIDTSIVIKPVDTV